MTATFRMQRNYLESKCKKGSQTGTQQKAPAIRAKVCHLFGISAPTYGKIVQGYLLNRSMYISGKDDEGRSGNRMAKQTRIPRTKAVQIAVSEWVRQRQAKRQRTTARQLLDYFTDKTLLILPERDSNSMKMGLRAVQHWLESYSYCRGKWTKNIVLSLQQMIKRNRYLSTFFKNRDLPVKEKLREVYMDKSYIHEHYHRNDDLIWDPNDEQDVQHSKAKAKGRRYCFACAIQGTNFRDKNDKAGVVLNTVWAFYPQQKGGHIGDYHKVFNGSNFIAWWHDKLLPNLATLSLIILDNAKYHLVKPEETPKVSKMKKAECITFLMLKGETVDPTMSAVQLKVKVKQWIDKNI